MRFGFPPCAPCGRDLVYSISSSGQTGRRALSEQAPACPFGPQRTGIQEDDLTRNRLDRGQKGWIMSLASLDDRNLRVADMGGPTETINQPVPLNTLEKFVEIHGELRKPEQTLLRSCAAGERAEFGSQRPAAPDESNTIRAGFLRFLLLHGRQNNFLHEHGVRLKGACIDGELDLENCCVPVEISLWGCSFSAAIILRDAQVFSLSLEGASVTDITADRLRCEQLVSLGEGLEANGPVRLRGARIGGDLVCHGSSFSGGEAGALLVGEAEIRGSVYLNDGFLANGLVELSHASITGDLICAGGEFHGWKSKPEDQTRGFALACDQAKIGGSVILSQGFTAKGGVSLRTARITGNLDCGGARIAGWPGKSKAGDDTFEQALVCDQAQIGGAVFGRSGFTAQGLVRLVEAEIGGDLDFSGGHLEGVQDEGHFSWAGHK